MKDQFDNIEIRYVPVEVVQGNSNKEEEKEPFNFYETLSLLWNKRKIIFVISLFFIVFGFIYAKTSINTFTSHAKILPEFQTQSQGLGRFSSLARQFGVGNIADNNSQDIIPSILYPEIILNNIFLSKMIDRKIYLDEINDSVTVATYFKEHQETNYLLKYTIGLPFQLLKLVRSQSSDTTDIERSNLGYIRFNDDQQIAIFGLKTNIVINRDMQTGLVSISFTSQSRETSVQILNHIIDLLKEYLIKYRTEKAVQNLEFIQQRHSKTYSDYTNLQQKLASFRDSNQGVLSAAARTEAQNIENEYNLLYNLYSSLSEQLEQAKIKLQQDTPVISLIQEPTYPLFKSSQSKLMLWINISFFGFILALLYVVFAPAISSFFEKLKKIKE